MPLDISISDPSNEHPFLNYDNGGLVEEEKTIGTCSKLMSTDNNYLVEKITTEYIYNESRKFSETANNLDIQVDSTTPLNPVEVGIQSKSQTSPPHMNMLSPSSRRSRARSRANGTPKRSETAEPTDEQNNTSPCRSITSADFDTDGTVVLNQNLLSSDIFNSENIMSANEEHETAIETVQDPTVNICIVQDGQESIEKSSEIMQPSSETISFEPTSSDDSTSLFIKDKFGRDVLATQENSAIVSRDRSHSVDSRPPISTQARGPVSKRIQRPTSPPPNSRLFLGNLATDRVCILHFPHTYTPPPQVIFFFTLCYCYCYYLYLLSTITTTYCLLLLLLLLPLLLLLLSTAYYNCCYYYYCCCCYYCCYCYDNFFYYYYYNTHP